MLSGIKIHDTVTNAFETMKIRKPRSDYTRKKFLRLRISEDEKFMILDTEFDTVQQTSDDGFQHLLKLLMPASCCFIIYDVSYGTKDSPIKEDLVLIQWCPEKAGTREKVQFSTTKGTLKGVLKGFKAELELNSLDDIDRSALAEKLGNDVLQVEGVNV